MAYRTVNVIPNRGTANYEENTRTEIENARLNDAELVSEVTAGRIGEISLVAKNAAQDTSIAANTSELETAKGSEISVGARLNTLDTNVADAETQIDINTSAIGGLSAQTGAKVSATDTTVGFLEDKITAKAGSGITITKINTGGNEKLEVDTPAVPTSEIGSATVTLAAGASHTLTLASSMSAIGQAHATVTKEVPQIGVTNNKWSIETDDTMFDLYDSAHSETITPAATTGETTLTLSSGSWAAEDVGRRVTGNGGEAVVTAVASAVADITVITDFTDTSPITSGNWQMYAGMFKEGAFSLSGFEAVDWDAWDGTADGVAAVFESATTGYISSVALDSTRVLVCYRDTGNSNYGTAIVLTANSDNTISTGTPAVYEPLNSTDYNSVCKVATDKALVCYNSPSQGKANVLSISGTSITVGTQAEFNSNTVSYVSVCEIGTDKALVCFTDSGGLHYGKARVLECYGTTTITAGTLSSYANATTLYHSVAHLDVDKAVVCFATGTTGYSAVLTITGTSIANGALSTFESAAVSFVSVAALSSTKAVVCYTDNGNSSHGTAVVLDISGTTVTPGTPVEYTSVAATYHSTVKIAESLIFVGYNDLTGTGCVLAITGGSVIPEAPVDFNAVISEHMSITLLDSGHIVASYQDAGNSDHGTSKVLNALSATYAADQFAVAMTNASGEINSEYFTDLNSFTPSDTLYGQSAFYGISMDGTTFEIVGDGETTLRNVVRFNTVWEYNSNATYGSETWTSASIDDPNVAVKEALSLTQNQMNSATAAAVLDATWPAFGSIFGVFIALKSTDSTKTPTVEKIDFNYDGQIKNVEKTHEYTVENPDVNTIKVTSNDASSTNVRIYVTK